MNRPDVSPQPYLARMDEQPLKRQSVNQLSPGDTGVWLITTQGSTHTLDLANGTYARHPGEGRDLHAHDETVVIWSRIETWPQVGGVMKVWYDDPDRPLEISQWRQTYTIKTIERIPATYESA